MLDLHQISVISVSQLASMSHTVGTSRGLFILLSIVGGGPCQSDWLFS